MQRNPHAGRPLTALCRWTHELRGLVLLVFLAALSPQVAGAQWTSQAPAYRVSADYVPVWRMRDPDLGWRAVPNTHFQSLTVGHTLWVRARIWLLLGEPVVICDVAYRPTEHWAGAQDIRPTAFALSFPSPIGSNVDRLVCDAGILSPPIAGRTPKEDDFSFNVPSVPGWSRFVTDKITTWPDQDPQGAKRALQAQRDGQERSNPAADARDFLLLCPTEKSRTTHRGWTCDGKHSLVWGKHQAGGPVLVATDVDATDYNRRLLEAHLEKSERALRKVERERERLQARTASAKDFWNTPSDTRTVAEAQADDDKTKALRDAIAQAQSDIAALKIAAERRNSRTEQARQELVQARRNWPTSSCAKTGGFYDARKGVCERAPRVDALSYFGTHRLSCELRPQDGSRQVFDFRCRVTLTDEASNRPEFARMPGRSLELTIGRYINYRLRTWPHSMERASEEGEYVARGIEMDPAHDWMIKIDHDDLEWKVRFVFHKGKLACDLETPGSACPPQ
jgi:hypothetical protein